MSKVYKTNLGFKVKPWVFYDTHEFGLVLHIAFWLIVVQSGRVGSN